jgi:hypothetical protein
MSTVVTTLMLVAATGVIGSTLVAWSNSSFSMQYLNISNTTNSRINLVRESFVLEDVWFYSPNKADVTIRNTGDLAVTVTKVYVNNSQAWSGSQVIPIGTGSRITVNNLSWGAGHLQSILVTTTRGGEVKQVWKS